MKVREVAPQVDPTKLLAGAQFVDAFSLEVDGRTLDAWHAAEKAFGRLPAWIDALVRLRNMIVTLLGLKRSAAQYSARPETLSREGAGAGNDRDVSGPERNAGSRGRGLQRQASRLPRRGRCRDFPRHPAGHRNHAGADA